MKLARQFLDRNRREARIADVIQKNVALKPSGKNRFLGLCPFHREKSPSFTVRIEPPLYHCFGCHAHGDVIDFTMRYHGLTFRDAVERLMRDFNIRSD